jgi:hypothetical protein
MELDYQVKPSASQRLKRINWRLVGFIGVFVLIFGSFFYVFASSVVTGGITHRSGYAEVDLKAMGQFPFDDVNGKFTDVPKLYRELDGQRVVLRGKMWAGNSAGKATQFQLVYDVAKCCFGGPPRVQERVFVRVPEGRPAAELMSPYDLMECTGKLHVRLQRNAEGTVTSLYDMDLESIRPVS